MRLHTIEQFAGGHLLCCQLELIGNIVTQAGCDKRINNLWFLRRTAYFLQLSQNLALKLCSFACRSFVGATCTALKNPDESGAYHPQHRYDQRGRQIGQPDLRFEWM
ncbi:MAG: hypothetical protein CL610_09335 [Anaerolineaceae bacterium]|nr:hypothetical protein [Anaerolineaceae bacterium]